MFKDINSELIANSYSTIITSVIIYPVSEELKSVEHSFIMGLVKANPNWFSILTVLILIFVLCLFVNDSKVAKKIYEVTCSIFCKFFIVISAYLLACSSYIVLHKGLQENFYYILVSIGLCSLFILMSSYLKVFFNFLAKKEKLCDKIAIIILCIFFSFSFFLFRMI